MTLKYLSLPFIVAFFVLAATQISQPYDICKIPCVQGFYDEYCGGISCVYGAQNQTQTKKMCSDECYEALLGAEMMNCLTDFDPYRKDFDSVISNKVYELMNQCGYDIGSIVAQEDLLIEGIFDIFG